MIEWLDAATKTGARKGKACAELGLTLRTVQRWQEEEQLKIDARTTVLKAPHNRLAASEREAILAVCNSAAYASLPPSQIVPRLADSDVYLASESTFYRVLKSAAQGQRRGRAHPPRSIATPTSHCASAPNEVWSWDITYLPSTVCGRFWYLYLFEDIFSRKIVGAEVYTEESGQHAADLLQLCAPTLSSIIKKVLVLHSDKYCPQWPSNGFETLQAARDWVAKFVAWYNTEHRHSRIRFVTPEQRHRGEDTAILAARHAVYEAAKAKRPERWSGATRNWQPIKSVMLNPDKVIVAQAA